MKKIISTIILSMWILLTFAQLDCSNFLANRKAEPPYKMSSLTKSAVVYSGGKYEYPVDLIIGKEYRLMFFASPVFNNQIHFKVIDTQGTLNDPSDDKVILDLPGENPNTGNAKGTAALVSYYDTKLKRDVHPYFDIVPRTSTTLKIIIEVAKAPEKTDEYNNTYREVLKGCLGIVILERDIEVGGFK